MRTKCLLISLTLLLTIDCFSQIPCSFKYRKRITFNPASISGPQDLTDFPAIISITGDNDLRVVASSGHVENANGYDIIFTASDGVTQLNHQLTSYSSTNGDLDCWVKIPVLSTSVNTYIYMYYGNTAISTDQSSTSTWSNGYVGVWHFDNDVNNFTATGSLNGTNNGTSSNTTSKIGNARRFQSASSQYIDVTPYNAAYNLFSDITVSAWVRTSSNGVDQKIAGNEDGVTGGWKFGVFTDNKLEFEIRTSANAPYLSRSASGGTALSNNTWYYSVGQYSDAGDFINTYLNGSLDRNYVTNAVCGGSSGTMKIGREPFASTAFLDGRMDELRVSNVIRSADWIATEYNNQNSPAPGSFYSITAEPKLWQGNTNGNWNTGGNWSGGAVPAVYADVIITNKTPANQPLLNTSPQISGLWVQSGTTLSISNQTISVAYDITNCGTILGNTGMVVLNSGPGYVQTQNLSGSGTYSFTNLNVNNTFNPSPKLVLNKDVNISGALVLNSGIVFTSNTNILALGNAATATGGSSSSFVSGPVSKIGTTNFVFPIGKGTRWRRASVTNLSASATFRAEYFNNAYASTTALNSPLDNVSVLEYWQVDRIAGAGNANLSLYWEDASASGITNCPDLTIARWNGTSWDERPGTTIAGSSCTTTGTGTITSNAVITAFSPFTFGSKLPNINPLPVELVSFVAHCDANGVVLDWLTYSENNNNYFTLERSIDGLNWLEITRVKGAGNSSSPKNYSFADSYKEKEIPYYRISQVDLDGSKKTFNLITAVCSRTENNVKIYPNPATSEIYLEFSSFQNLEDGMIRITDNTGRLCFEQKINTDDSGKKITIPINLLPGMYTTRLTNGKSVLYVSKLVVQ